MKKVRFFPPNLQNKKPEKGVPVVPSYRPILNSLSKIIRDSMYLLNMNEEVTETFSPGPMVSFWSARKLSSYLVRAKLHPLQRKIGSLKCGKRRCEVCNNVTGTSTFSSTVTGDTSKINHRLNWVYKISVFSVLWPANSVTNNTWVKLQICFVIDGITIKIVLEIWQESCMQVKGSPRLSEWGVSYI